MYDIKTKEWKLPKFTVINETWKNITNHVAVTVSDKIYVFGGY